MAKDPAFLFYPNDYIGGTMGWSFEEKGAYMEILMMQFNRGHMTEHMIGHIVGQLWDKLKDKFEVDDKGLYFNVRLEEEKTKRQRFTNSRKNNLSGVNQHTKKEENNIGHMSNHMEDENVNVIINKNKDKKELNIPTIEEFLLVAKEKLITAKLDFVKYEYSITEKYNQWKEDGWKDGNNSKIKNWKTKIANTIPYLKPIYKKEEVTIGRNQLN